MAAARCLIEVEMRLRLPKPFSSDNAGRRTGQINQEEIQVKDNRRQPHVEDIPVSRAFEFDRSRTRSQSSKHLAGKPLWQSDVRGKFHGAVSLHLEAIVGEGKAVCASMAIS
jgi:hypothetical protein